MFPIGYQRASPSFPIPIWARLQEVYNTEEVVYKNCKPDRPSGEQGELGYYGKHNWLRKSELGQAASGQDEEQKKGSVGRR